MFSVSPVTTSQTAVSAILGQVDKLLRGATTSSSRTTAERLRIDLKQHECNLRGANSWCCRTTNDKAIREYAESALPGVSDRIAQLDKKFGLGPNWYARGALLVGSAALLAGHYFKVLPSTMSTVLPEAIVNATKTLNATALADPVISVVAAVSSPSWLIPFAIGAVSATAAAYFLSKCLPN